MEKISEVAEPNLYDFLSEAQAAELEAYGEACENYSENRAEWANEVAQFGDATFTCPEAPKLPDWYEDAYTSYCKALDRWANSFDTEAKAYLPF